MGDDGTELVDLVGPFWSATKVSDALGLATDEELDGLVRHGRLLGLTTSDGHKVFPMFQFRAGQDGTEVLPGLVPVLTALRGHDYWAVAVLLRTPADELGGSTPLAWVQSGGDSVTLSRFAARVDAEWSR